MKGPMRSAIAGCVLMVATCLAIAAQNGKVASDESGRIVSLESAWNQAEVQHDARAMGMLLAETFEYTDSDGRFMNRGQWLDLIRNGVDQYEQLGNTGMTVHLYGNVAIVTGGYRERIKSKRNALVRFGRFTDTWIEQNGQWKCVASQATLISY
jgi:hypothetical protein